MNNLKLTDSQVITSSSYYSAVSGAISSSYTMLTTASEKQIFDLYTKTSQNMVSHLLSYTYSGCKKFSAIPFDVEDMMESLLDCKNATLKNQCELAILNGNNLFDQQLNAKMTQAIFKEAHSSYFQSTNFIAPIAGLFVAATLSSYGALKCAENTLKGMVKTIYNVRHCLARTEGLTYKTKDSDLVGTPTTPCKELGKSIKATTINAVLASAFAGITYFIGDSLQKHLEGIAQSSAPNIGPSHYYNHYPHTFCSSFSNLSWSELNSPSYADATMNFPVAHPLFSSALFIGAAASFYALKRRCHPHIT